MSENIEVVIVQSDNWEITDDIKSISEEVENLVNSMKTKGTEVTCEIVNGWIMEVLKEIHNRKQIITVTHYLLTNEHTLGNLLKVYSFVKHCYDTSSLRKYDNW